MHCAAAFGKSVIPSAAQTRLHALEVCDLLFSRSRAFRTAAAVQFPALLEASVGFRPARPLPGPSHLATQLRERALDAVERWNDNYGVFYQQASLWVFAFTLEFTFGKNEIRRAALMTFQFLHHAMQRCTQVMTLDEFLG